MPHDSNKAQAMLSFLDMTALTLRHPHAGTNAAHGSRTNLYIAEVVVHW